MPYLQGTYRVSISKSLYGKWVPVLWLVDTHTHTHTHHVFPTFFFFCLSFLLTHLLYASHHARGGSWAAQ